MTRIQAQQAFKKLKQDLRDGKFSYKIYIARKKVLKRIILKGVKNGKAEENKKSNLHN